MSECMEQWNHHSPNLGQPRRVSISWSFDGLPEKQCWLCQQSVSEIWQNSDQEYIIPRTYMHTSPWLYQLEILSAFGLRCVGLHTDFA